MGRREYMAATAAALTGTAGCVETEEEKLEQTSINELLENPEAHTDQTVKTSGEPEYNGDVTYTIIIYDPALEMARPQPTTDPTYTLHAEDGDQELPFRTNTKPDALADLKEGEKLDQTVQVTGNFEEVEKDNQKAYMIREAQVESI